MCLVHAYANDAHEKRVLEILKRGISGLHRSRISRRCRPNIANMSAPLRRWWTLSSSRNMDRYLPAREGCARRPASASKPFLVMQSNGGVMSAGQVVNKPITAALGRGPQRACSEAR